MVASYPFDDSASHQEQGSYSQTEDDGLFRYLAQVYSHKHPIMRTGQPNCSDAVGDTFKDGITNGAQWYDVTGEAVHTESQRFIEWIRCKHYMCTCTGCYHIVVLLVASFLFLF